MLEAARRRQTSAIRHILMRLAKLTRRREILPYCNCHSLRDQLSRGARGIF